MSLMNESKSKMVDRFLKKAIKIHVLALQMHPNINAFSHNQSRICMPIDFQKVGNSVRKTALIRATEHYFCETKLFCWINGMCLMFINVQDDSRQDITREVNKVQHSIQIRFV